MKASAILRSYCAVTEFTSGLEYSHGNANSISVKKINFFTCTEADWDLSDCP